MSGGRLTTGFSTLRPSFTLPSPYHQRLCCKVSFLISRRESWTTLIVFNMWSLTTYTTTSFPTCSLTHHLTLFKHIFIFKLHIFNLGAGSCFLATNEGHYFIVSFPFIGLLLLTGHWWGPLFWSFVTWVLLPCFFWHFLQLHSMIPFSLIFCLSVSKDLWK